MEEALRAKLLDLLSSQHLMTLATIRPDGYPQATTVNYINDGLTVYFATDAAAQKAGNIALNNKVSIAITSQTEDLYKLSGLSMSGVATRILEKQTADSAPLQQAPTVEKVRSARSGEPRRLFDHAGRHCPSRLCLWLRQALFGRTLTALINERFARRSHVVIDALGPSRTSPWHGRTTAHEVEVACIGSCLAGIYRPLAVNRR